VLLTVHKYHSRFIFRDTNILPKWLIVMRNTANVTHGKAIESFSGVRDGTTSMREREGDSQVLFFLLDTTRDRFTLRKKIYLVTFKIILRNNGASRNQVFETVSPKRSLFWTCMLCFISAIKSIFLFTSMLLEMLQTWQEASPSPSDLSLRNITLKTFYNWVVKLKFMALNKYYYCTVSRFIFVLKIPN
jgi:hypothetical protein